MTQFYNVLLNERQVAMLQDMAEVWLRFKMGQVYEGLDVLFRKKYLQLDDPDIEKIRQRLFPDMRQNESYGVGNEDHPELAMAYNLMTAFRYANPLDTSSIGKEKPLFRKEAPTIEITPTDDVTMEYAYAHYIDVDELDFTESDPSFLEAEFGREVWD